MTRIDSSKRTTNLGTRLNDDRKEKLEKRKKCSWREFGGRNQTDQNKRLRVSGDD